MLLLHTFPAFPVEQPLLLAIQLLPVFLCAAPVAFPQLRISTGFNPINTIHPREIPAWYVVDDTNHVRFGGLLYGILPLLAGMFFLDMCLLLDYVPGSASPHAQFIMALCGSTFFATLLHIVMAKSFLIGIISIVITITLLSKRGEIRMFVILYAYIATLFSFEALVVTQHFPIAHNLLILLHSKTHIPVHALAALAFCLGASIRGCILLYFLFSNRVRFTFYNSLIQRKFNYPFIPVRYFPQDTTSNVFS